MSSQFSLDSADWRKCKEEDRVLLLPLQPLQLLQLLPLRLPNLQLQPARMESVQVERLRWSRVWMPPLPPCLDWRPLCSPRPLFRLICTRVRRFGEVRQMMHDRPHHDCFWDTVALLLEVFYRFFRMHAGVLWFSSLFLSGFSSQREIDWIEEQCIWFAVKLRIDYPLTRMIP